VAELVDAHDSGSCARKGVEVRVFSSALSSESRKIKEKNYEDAGESLHCHPEFIDRSCPARVLLIKPDTIST
jgi:hypothetical protein